MRSRRSACGDRGGGPSIRGPVSIRVPVPGRSRHGPLLFVYAAAAFGIWCAWIVAESLYYQGLLGPALQRALGFREGKVIRPNGGLTGYESAVAILGVDEGGTFARAGFRAGDVLPEESHTSLFRALHRHRGGVARFRVVDGGEGLPFRQRARREIEVAIPTRGHRAARR